ncbi:GAF domain-containing protein [Hyalangium rubrum]|uniref:histidine kinase n=1 Tax=Hyalangium rubrum TaxID=3103134 RepID=A0ABU5HD08_9BACT|nr:GAF domain-containing protein [Hyalangium sp. s54d21]MDY7231353.1 GAF domain-containing protein [Hyalangium sp. s54d21]
MRVPLEPPVPPQAGAGSPQGGDPKFAPLLDSVTDGIVVVDRDWRITYLNAVAEKVSGRPREKALGRELWAEVPQLLDTPFAKAFHETAATGQRTTVSDYFAPADAWYEARAFPSSEGLVIFVRDITDLRQAEVERLRLLNAERSSREDAERAAHRLVRLQELTAQLAAARSPEEVMSAAIERIMSAVGANLALVGLPVEEGRMLRVVAWRGLPRQLVQDHPLLPVDAPLPVSTAWRTAEPEWLESPEALGARYPKLLSILLEKTAARSVASLPMVVEGRVLAVLALGFPEPRAFSGDDREFLLALVRHCALAMERARLLSEVEAQRARLEDLVMRVPAVMSVTRGAEHRFVLCNPRHRQLMGGRDLTGLTVREALPEMAGQGFFELMDRVYTSGEPFIGKEVPLRFNGQPSDVLPETFFDFVYQPLRDAEGKVEGIASFAFDVTDQVLGRRTVEELLRDMARSEERFRAFLTATSEIIWDMPPSGVFDSDQPGWRAFTGQRREALLGWGWLQAVHPEDRDLIERAWRESVRAGASLQSEVRLRRQDGVYRHMQMRAVPVLELDGTVREWVGIHRDVTRQHEDAAERERLLAQEQRHRTQLEGLAKASLAIGQAASLDAVLQVTTEQARALIGAHQSVTSLTTSEDGTQTINSVSLSDKYRAWNGYAVPPNGAGIYMEVCRTNRSLRMTQEELEAHPKWRGFGAHAAEHPPMRGWLAVPLIGRNGRNLGLIQLSDRYEGEFNAEDEAILVQLARLSSVAIENARLMAESQAANRAKDEFLAVMSHELRTPLTAVLGWTQMLRSRKDDSAVREKGLEVIERNARSLAQLIEDVLDVSRILTGKLTLHRKAVELAGVVQAAVEVVRPRADQKEVSLSVEVAPGVGLVTGDPGRLQQVFWNLLANAVKFTQEGGRVEVRVERGEGEWRVRVRDTGQGIRPEALPHLFERFWQADGSSTREHGGLGLGLAIVRHLVELHGGSVEAQSPGPGQGSTFTVRLPVPALLPEAERAASAEAAKATRLDGVRVLLVEDAEDARELITLLLKERGAEVRATANAREAMESLTASLPDVLVSDIGLPGEDGHTLLKRVREWSEARDQWIPAIALTAYAGAEDARRAYRAGFQVHMAKPLEAEALVESVARLAARDGQSSSST